MRIVKVGRLEMVCGTEEYVEDGCGESNCVEREKRIRKKLCTENK